MAAFCGCCGAEITLRAEACPVCKTPRHGMAQPPDSLSPVDNLPGPIPAQPPASGIAVRLDQGSFRTGCCTRS